MAIAVETAFEWAGLKPLGPVAWGDRLVERQPGIYVVALSAGAALGVDSLDLKGLPPQEMTKWVPGERIVYIGRTRRPLRARIQEFYRHTYGGRSPHRGGQAVLLLTVPRFIYWATTDHPTEAEHLMIETFKSKTGRLPFANRSRGWRQARQQV